MARHEYVGGAPQTTLSGSSMTAGSPGDGGTFTAASGTGYPTGSVGPFVVIIDKGLANAEKILCSSRSGAVFTVATGGRGYDNTTAASHSSGSATINHPVDAASFTDFARHVYAGDDDHTIYAKKASNLSDLANAGTARTNLGLGTMATQAASGVAITGGTIAGITDLPVADGGTGASTAAAARTNLGAAGLTGDETLAGVKTFSSDPLIPDEAYGSGWNGVLEPPTKNAVYDKIESMGTAGTIQTYTPALTASTSNPTLGSGSTAEGRYTQIGNLVTVWVIIKFGTSGTNAGSGTYRVSLPVTARDSTINQSAGAGYAVDTAGSPGVTSAYPVVPPAANGVYVQLYSTSSGDFITHSSPIPWAANDEISLTITYESA